MADDAAILRAALDAANARSNSLVRERDDARTQLHSETANRFAAQEQAIDNAIVAAENERITLSDKWTTHQTDGNHADASRVMGQMAEAAARIDRLKAQKEYVSGQRQQQSSAPPASTDPLANFNPAEREWISKNPAYLSDQTFQARVNQAHYKALGEGVAKDSPQYWNSIERTVYPDRFVEPKPEVKATTPAEETDESETPFSGADSAITIDESPPIQQHTRNADPAPLQVDSREMRIEPDDADVVDKPKRAIGQGGEGIRSVAAPPSRRVIQRSNEAARGGTISATTEEVLAARALYDAIEPNAEDRSDTAAVRWYHAMAHHPSHQHTRRRSWARESIV